MSVNPHPTKAGYYQIRYYPNGRKGGQKVENYKGTEEGARLAEARLKKNLGLLTDARATRVPRIGEAIPDFLTWYADNNLAPEVMTRYVEKWKPYVSHLHFSSVTTDIIEKYKSDRLAQGIKRNTINKELTGINGLLKWGKEKKYCTRIPEAKRYPAKMTKPALPVVPPVDIIKVLLDGMIWPRCGLIASLYYGGLRRNEGIFLKAEDVHLDLGYIVVRGKGNKQRVVPIVDKFRPWLEKRLKEVSSGYLWTTQNGKPIRDLRPMIKNARKRVGIETHIYPHLLRHAFGTHATVSGVGVRQLQEIMGHEQVSTTEIYTTLANTMLLDELQSKFETDS